MDETAAGDAGVEPAVVVEVTPGDYRARSIGFVVGGVLLTAVAVWLEVRHGRSDVNPFLGPGAVAYGLWCALQARRQVTRTLLRIDRSGLTSDDGLHDHTWAGVEMVWVGSSTGLRLPVVGRPVLSLFTSAGVDFATRAGTRLKPRSTIPVGPPWTVRTLCDQLAQITPVLVVDGTEVSRAAAAAELQRRERG